MLYASKQAVYAFIAVWTVISVVFTITAAATQKFGGRSMVFSGIATCMILNIMENKNVDPCIYYIMAGICLICTCISAKLFLTPSWKKKREKAAAEKKRAEEDEKAYFQDDNYYKINYKFSVIGNNIIYQPKDSLMVCIRDVTDRFLDSYSKILKIRERAPEHLPVIEFRMRNSGCSGREQSFMMVPSDSPIIRDYSTEHGITEFTISFVICKPMILVKAINENPNCIIFCGNRHTGHISIYTVENGNADLYADWKISNKEGYEPLWRLVTGYTEHSTGVMEVVDSLCTKEVFGAIFKLVTRYDPMYSPSYSYDY